jgi:hypothetical protein
MDCLFASSITNTVLKGELFTTAKPALIDAFEPIVKDEDATNDDGASTRTRSKSGHFRKKYFSIFISRLVERDDGGDDKLTLLIVRKNSYLQIAATFVL